MVDEVLDDLATFVDSLEVGDLSPTTIHEAKRRLVDSMGCLFGAIDSGPADLARNLAGEVSGTPAASVVGLDVPSTLEMATFANSVMLRYLIINDAPHFSEMIPAVLGAAEATHNSGGSILLGTTIAYEIAQTLTKSAGGSNYGIDPATWETVAVALVAGKLFGLSRDQLGHAASMAAISHISLWARASGAISKWGLCSSAAANRYGIQAAQLARAGITGPEQPFTGKDGIMDVIVRHQFSVDLDLPLKRPYCIEVTDMKTTPTGTSAQGPIELMISLRDRIPVDQIEDIRVDTWYRPYAVNGERVTPAKWDPQTKETAEHSIPYVLAVALVDGVVNNDAFEEERYSDPALRPIMETMNIYKNPEYEAKIPDELNSHLTIRLRSGEVIEAHQTHPHGHHLNPFSDEEVNAKFDELTLRTTDDLARCHAVRDMLWNLEAVDNLDEFFCLLRGLRPR